MRYYHSGLIQSFTCTYTVVPRSSSFTPLMTPGKMRIRLFAFQFSWVVDSAEREGKTEWLSIKSAYGQFFLSQTRYLHSVHVRTIKHFSESVIMGSTYNSYKPICSDCRRMGTFSFIRGIHLNIYSSFISINRCYS